VIAHRGALEPLPSPRLKTVSLHQTNHALATDALVLLDQIFVSPRAAIPLAALIEGCPHQDAQPAIGLRVRGLGALSLPEIRDLFPSLPLWVETDTVRRSMPALLVAVLAAVRSFARSRLEFEAEILALRHQLAVLQRQTPTRPRPGRADRRLWVLLSRLWPNWRGAIQIVTPDTVVRWHRRGFGLYRVWKSRPRRAGRRQWVPTSRR
jgi:hypothetical protein